MTDDAIELCLAGVISPQVALARLLLGGAAPDALAATLASRRPAGPNPAWHALHRLVLDRPQMLSRLAAEIAAMPVEEGPADAGPGPTAAVAAFFDRAVAFSPEASVALYSLGDPAILAEATAEIMRWLDGWLGAQADVLDLGCGIGRILQALAPRCGSVLGLDVSAGMAAAARQRCAGLANVRIEQTAGLDLDALAGGAFDLVLAVDSFPYVLQAGAAVVEAHLRGVARVLRPGGHLVVLNLSYGRDLAADRADAAAWALAYGFDLVVDGARPFTLWDGSAFVLRRLGDR